MSKEFECTVKIEWYETHEAENKEHFVQRLKEIFYETFNIELSDTEISDIKEVV